LQQTKASPDSTSALPLPQESFSQSLFFTHSFRYVGLKDGFDEGCDVVGAKVGTIVGFNVGCRVGSIVGFKVGFNVGCGVGSIVGLSVGSGVGHLVACEVGYTVGCDDDTG
jgi:hypothetical protein